MKQMVIDFIDLLRTVGVSVSTSEAVDCLEAFELTGFQPSRLKVIMKITLIKSLWEQQLFERLYHLYFDMHSTFYAAEKETTSEISCCESRRQNSNSQQESLEKLLAGGTAVELQQLASESISNVSLTAGTSKEMAVKLRELQLLKGWFQEEKRIHQRYARGEMTELDYQGWLKRLRFVKMNMRRELESMAVRQFGRKAVIPLLKEANIRRREFSRLTLEEIDQVEGEIRKLARRLASRPGLRMRRAKNGTVNMRRTIQNMLRSGGTPIRLHYQARVKSKADLWLLCDVSSSVELFSRFMLQLVQETQKRYAHVRSFIFVDQVVEVTEWFQTKNVNDLLEARQMRSCFSQVGVSRYDQVFGCFASNEIMEITSHTKIIILGDACNNRHPGLPHELEKISHRSRAIYWLNPLPKKRWNEGSCLMREYEPHCRQVFECRNLEQLIQVANQIL